MDPCHQSMFRLWRWWSGQVGGDGFRQEERVGETLQGLERRELSRRVILRTTWMLHRRPRWTGHEVSRKVPKDIVAWLCSDPIIWE